MELGIGENNSAWLEPDFGTGLVRITDSFQRFFGFTQCVFLVVKLAITANGQFQTFR